MKVFLSSTYIDLIEHRKAAHDALERLGQEVGRMEIFGAKTEEATSVARDQLEKCDLVVGIYAYRYGFIPDGSDISITEQEYLHAKSKGKPVLCFVVDENEPWPPKMMERDAVKIKKLDDFKARVLKEKVVDFFTTPADLAMKIATSVHNYLEEHKPIPDSRIPIYQQPKPTGSTLPRETFFVGREKELEIIKSALSSESRTWGALIDGPGGIGKTALAIKAAHEAPTELFERKIFISAKVRELTTEGEKPLTDFTRPTYLAMLDELGKELGEEGLEKLPPDDRPDKLRLAMADKKALIIFDNLETLPEEERTRLFQFLSRLPEGNKAIVTSRRRSDVDARIVRLDRLARDEALQLIAELAAKYPRLARASQKECEDLYEITQGNPLFIRWIAGQLGKEGSHLRTIQESVAFIDKAPKGNDPLEYIFGDLLETFTEDETKVLAALTHFTLPAKLNWIAEMTALPERQAETALEDLTDRSILIPNYQLPNYQPSDSPTYYLPPLTAKFIRTRRPEAVTQTGDALTNSVYALAMQYGGEDDYEGFPTLDAEWGFVSAAMPRLLDVENEKLQKFCDAINQFLYFRGHFDEWLWLNGQACERAREASDMHYAGIRDLEIGWTYYYRNQIDQALIHAKQAEQLLQGSDKHLQANRLISLALLEDKKYSLAIEILQEELNILRSGNASGFSILTLLNDLGFASFYSNDLGTAEKQFRDAQELGINLNQVEGIMVSKSGLADVYLKRQEWQLAETTAREALKYSEKLERLTAIALNCYRIAVALLQQGNPKEGIVYVRRAIEIFARLRQQDNLLEAQETLAEIEKALEAKKKKKKGPASNPDKSRANS